MFENIWVEKYRPQTLDDIILSKSTREYFDQMKKTQEMPHHLLFCGYPGSGKTSLAKIIAKDILDVSYMYINASDERGIDTIRLKVTNFAQTKSIDGKFKIIILDEMDGLTSDAQRALRNTTEEYADNARFILTANSMSRITTPIKSRVIHFDLVPPMEEAIVRCLEILKKENIKVNGEKDKLMALLQSCYPDLRKMINTMGKHIKDGVITIGEEKVDNSFIQEILTRIGSKHTDYELRKYIIENETEFNNDYNILLKSLFDLIADSTSLSEISKRECMLTVGEGLYRHSFVMDFEINAYCTILKLRKILQP
jgi:DNA polymerase III delta prime subunit